MQGKDKIGQRRLSRQGQEMKLIKYRGGNSVDVQFEDGTIVEDRAYSSFKSGHIKNPNDKIGLKTTNRSGLEMEIVEYNNHDNVIIRFNDGTKVKTTYTHFKDGRVRNPNEHIGELYMLVNGITARVCEYADIEHVTVELNTGEIVSSVHYKTLQNGSLGKDWKLKNGINYRSGAKKS